MRHVDFAPGEYYHVFDRGAGAQTIFHDKEDFQFFLKLLCACNTTATGRKQERQPKNLVSIISYTLMPNHFHVQLVEQAESGVSRFMHNTKRIYSRYYNIKYNRKGTLYQSPFGVRHIVSETHLDHLPRYIHLNILDLTEHDWRSGNVQDWQRSLDFMKNYEWSSHSTYITKTQFYPIIDLKLVDEIFPSSEAYIEFLRSWSQSDIAIADLHFISSK